MISTEAVTATEHRHEHDFKIIVNGREKTVSSDVVTFDEVVHLAFDPLPTGQDLMFTVTYRHAAGDKPDGTLVEGQAVKIKDGTIFHVTPTNKS